MFGADPEYFASYEKEGKKYVLSPALMEREFGIKAISGDTKHPVYIRQKEFSWMMDGVAWELTLLRPHDHLIDVWKATRDALDCLAGFFGELHSSSFSNISLYTKPAIFIEPSLYLPLLNDERVYQGFIFGCDPDLDAVNPMYECATIDVSTHPYRYGGGHIHISGDDILSENPRPMIMLLACTIGNYVTLHSKEPELERLRVETYGRPGRFRIQNYPNGGRGVEYRTPSNQWTLFEPSEIEEMESLIQKADGYLHNPQIGKKVLDTFLTDSCEAICHVNQEQSKNILAALP